MLTWFFQLLTVSGGPVWRHGFRALQLSAVGQQCPKVCVGLPSEVLLLLGFPAVCSACCDGAQGSSRASYLTSSVEWAQILSGIMLAFGQCQSAPTPRIAPCTHSYASRSPLQHRSRSCSGPVLSPLRAPEAAGRLQTAYRSRRCCGQTFASRADDELHLQLATAKLPK